jgi:hypothetical protein
VFSFDGDSWLEDGKLTASDAAAGNRFGNTVSMDGSTIISGAFLDDDGGTASGSAYVFQCDTNSSPECTEDLAQAWIDFGVNDELIVTAGETFTGYFTGDDADGDDLVASVSGLPGAVLSPMSGSSPLMVMLTWTPTAADAAGAPYTVTVTFEDPSGDAADCEFTIADVNLSPSCSAGSYPVFECGDSAGELVTLSGNGTDPDGDTLFYHWDVSDASVLLNDDEITSPSGFFPIGITMVTLTVTDGRGGVCTSDALVRVQDTMPPEVMCTTSVAALWPPKHNMRSVSLIVAATDACQDPDFIFPITVTVRSDESDNATGNGDGNTTGDVNSQDGFSAAVNVTGELTWNPVAEQYEGTIQLRAERAGSGDGRCYTIDVIALDSQGNAANTSCCVVVPHDRRGGGGN